MIRLVPTSLALMLALLSANSLADTEPVERRVMTAENRHDAREDRHDARDECSDKLNRHRRENCIEDEREDWVDDREDDREDRHDRRR